MRRVPCLIVVRPPQQFQQLAMLTAMRRASSRVSRWGHRQSGEAKSAAFVAAASSAGMLTATFRRLGGAARLPFLDFLIFNLARDYDGSIRSHNFPRFVTEGGLISFRIDQAALYRLAASRPDRILKGVAFSFLATSPSSIASENASNCKHFVLRNRMITSVAQFNAKPAPSHSFDTSVFAGEVPV
jgi:hypothetical protein